MKVTVEKAFTSHVLRYVGVGIISGSIVHIGTLGGDITHYLVLVTLGIASFIAGTILEKEKGAITVQFIAISVLMSIGVGMVSGGTQHYLDGPLYAAFLLPLGLLLGYITYVFLEDRKELKMRKVITAFLLSLALFFVLYGVSERLEESRREHEKSLEGHSH